jgi:hypothetical protein
MDLAGAFRRRRQGEIDALGGEAAREIGAGEIGAARLERGRDLVLELVHAQPEGALLVALQAAEPAHQGADAAFLADRADAHLLQRREVGRRRDRLAKLRFQPIEIIHLYCST